MNRSATPHHLHPPPTTQTFQIKGVTMAVTMCVFMGVLYNVTSLTRHSAASTPSLYPISAVSAVKPASCPPPAPPTMEFLPRGDGSRGNESLDKLILGGWRQVQPGYFEVDELFEETCIDPWSIPLPLTENSNETKEWLTRERPYGDCNLVHDGQACEFSGGCSNYQVAHHAYVPYGALGSCGSQPRLDVVTAKPDEECDNRTFVPLNLPESLFFGHLETLFTKLVRVIARGDHQNTLFYIRRHFSMSENVLQLLKRMGFTVVVDYPHGKCFERVVWVCHSVSIDPDALRNTSRAVRRAMTPTPAEARQLPVLANMRREPCRRVYFARNSRGARNGRFIAGESTLATTLWRKHGYCILNGDVAFNVTTDAMSRVEVLVAAHGGALMNMLWLDPRRRPIVIELDGFRKYAKYWLLASALGYRYGWMSFDPKQGINAERVVALEMMLEQLPTPPLGNWTVPVL